MTPAQLRVLTFLRKTRNWHDICELDQIKLLHEDDIVVLPSLVKADLVEYMVQGNITLYRARSEMA